MKCIVIDQVSPHDGVAYRCVGCRELQEMMADVRLSIKFVKQ